MPSAQPLLSDDIFIKENPDYTRTQLITYIGNKRALLPFIEKGFQHVQNSLGKKTLTILDLFSGTGVVARMAKSYASKIIANDLELYSQISNECYLSNASEVNFRGLQTYLSEIKSYINDHWKPGFITELYAPLDEDHITSDDRVFYTRRNATYLDTACQAIARIPEPLRKYFLGPLLSQASMYANTSGVFKGFYKNREGVGQFGGTGKNALTRILRNVELDLPIFSHFECDYEVYRSDANALIHQIDEVDVAYFDPPYNQHPYGSNYFMLNLLCNYERPHSISRVSGIPTDWNRSAFNTRQNAKRKLFELVEQCKAKFILISYNSEGFIRPDEFLAELKSVGKISVMDTPYNTFRGSRNLQNRDIHVTEFLYLIDKR